MPVAPESRSPLLVGFALVLALIVALIQLDFIEYAYERIGVAPQYVLGVLLVSLLGSSINIPITTLARDLGRNGHPAVAPGRPDDPAPGRGTILAVNLGGAVIPTLLSAYLLAHSQPFAPAAMATAVVAAAVHLMARPVARVGISVPILIPPVVAAAAAVLISPDTAPAVAYIAGTLGTLIGADLTNLQLLRGIGAPVASIGGGGTFDAIFVTGILAVLLA
jgi:uncharacterized membrane protein